MAGESSLSPEHKHFTGAQPGAPAGKSSSLGILTLQKEILLEPRKCFFFMEDFWCVFLGKVDCCL